MMEKSDWVLFSEFETLMDIERFSLILRHKTCKATININLIPAPPTVLTLKNIVQYAIEHKKNDCKIFQRLMSKVTIHDEVDNG